MQIWWRNARVFTVRSSCDGLYSLCCVTQDLRAWDTTVLAGCTGFGNALGNNPTKLLLATFGGELGCVSTPNAPTIDSVCGCETCQGIATTGCLTAGGSLELSLFGIDFVGNPLPV